MKAGTFISEQTCLQYVGWGSGEGGAEGPGPKSTTRHNVIMLWLISIHYVHLIILRNLKNCITLKRHSLSRTMVRNIHINIYIIKILESTETHVSFASLCLKKGLY